MGFFSRLALTPAATGIQRPVSSSEVRIRGEVTRSPAPPSKGSRQLLLRARVQAHVRDPHPRYVRHAPKDQEDPPTSPSPPNPPWRIPPCQQGHPGDVHRRPSLQASQQLPLAIQAELRQGRSPKEAPRIQRGWPMWQPWAVHELPHLPHVV